MSFERTALRLICLITILTLLTSAALAAGTSTQSGMVTVTFSAGGGSPTPAKETLDKGNHLSATPFLTRKGYTFAGWYTDSKYKEPFSITNAIESNIRLYAKWNKNPVVTFNTKGGKPSIPKQSPLTGETIEIPVEPAKTGYIFRGWYSDSKYTQEFNFYTPIMSNTTLYAKWEAIPVVSFSSGGGKPAAQKQTVVTGDTATPPPAMTKEGYTFVGWYTSIKYTTEYDFSKPVYGRMTLYAKWVRNPVVKFSTKGKCPVPEKQTLMPGQTAYEPYLSIPDGYIMDGWYRDSACKKAFDFNAPVETGLTVYANVIRDPNIPMIAVRKK